MSEQLLLIAAVALGVFGAYVLIRFQEHLDRKRQARRALEREVDAMWTAHMWRVAQVWRSQLSEYDMMRLNGDRKVFEEMMPHDKTGSTPSSL
jgi:hypothetical protein